MQISYSMLGELLTSRTKAGADTPKGRQLTVVAQVIQVVPVDDDHARRKLGVLIRAERGLRAVVAADCGGAA